MATQDQIDWAKIAGAVHANVARAGRRWTVEDAIAVHQGSARRLLDAEERLACERAFTERLAAPVGARVA